MKLTQLFTFALASLAAAAPLESSESALEPRQSQRWNDDFIGEPRDFKATRVRNCVYQVAYRRDNGDGRYEKSFDVIHGSTSRSINGQSSANNFQFWAEYVGDLIVFNIANACSNGASGAEPSAFRVKFRLPPNQYTYVNNWNSDPIRVTAGPVPAIPGRISTSRPQRRQVRVNWQPVSGASGYIIKSSGLTNSEVGDVRYWTEDKISGGSTSSGIANGGRIDRIAVLALGPDTRVVSDFINTPIINVPA